MLTEFDEMERVRKTKALRFIGIDSSLMTITAIVALLLRLAGKPRGMYILGQPIYDDFRPSQRQHQIRQYVAETKK